MVEPVIQVWFWARRRRKDGQTIQRNPSRRWAKGSSNSLILKENYSFLSPKVAAAVGVLPSRASLRLRSCPAALALRLRITFLRFPSAAITLLHSCRGTASTTTWVALGRAFFTLNSEDLWIHAKIDLRAAGAHYLGKLELRSYDFQENQPPHLDCRRRLDDCGL